MPHTGHKKSHQLWFFGDRFVAVGTEVRRQMVPCLEMHIASNFVGTHGIQGRPNTRENVKENKTEIFSEKV